MSGNVNNSFSTNDDVYHVVVSVNDNANTSLNGFTITKGNATGFGVTEIEKVNLSKGSGGALYASNSLLKLENCTFNANNAFYGGAVYTESSTLTIDNCLFQSNSSTNGGALYSVQSSPQILNSSFENNSAFKGGALFNENNSSPNIDNCSFSSNQASLNGGGIFNENLSSPVIQNTSFSGNGASNFGGAINNTDQSSPQITNCTFTVNNANFGGGIYNIDQSSPNITDCSFFGNSAPNKGGAIYNENASIAQISDCLFQGNNSNSGGAVYNLSAASSISHSSFVSNTGGFGGAIANSGSSGQINNVILTGNFATSSGGAIHNSQSSNPVVSNCTFTSNNSARGGAVNNSSNSFPIFKNDVFWDNEVDGSNSTMGADIFNASNAKVQVTHTLLQLANNSSNYPSSTTSGFQGLLNSNYFGANPLFSNQADPNGTDNVYGTVDDGLRLTFCSPGMNTGSNVGISATDISDSTRLENNFVDMGAYENKSPTPISLSRSPATAFCYGTSVTFTATPVLALGGQTFRFKLNGEELQSSSSTTFTIDTLKDDDLVLVFLNSTSCEVSGNSNYQEMSVYDLPVPIVVGDTVCAGFDINLLGSNENAASGNNYSWTGPGFATANNSQNPTISNATEIMSGKYNLQITDANSCINLDSTLVLVRPLPTGIISGGGTICAGETLPDVQVDLTGTPSYTFTYNDGSKDSTVEKVAASPYIISEASAGNYTITALTDSFCVATATQLTGLADVIVNPIPPVPAISSPVQKVICFQSTLSLLVTNCSGTVNWLNNSTMVATTANPLVLDTVNTYVISAICTELGCISDTSDIITGLEIKPKPDPPIINLLSLETVCEPDSIRLSASCTSGTLIWGDNSTAANLVLKAVGTYTITALCSLNGCISDLTSHPNSLEIKAKPNAPSLTEPLEQTVCEPSTLTIGSSCSSGTILWSDNSINSNLTLSIPGTYTISAICLLMGCESDTAKATELVIKEKPAAPTIIAPVILEVCEPDSLIFKGSCAAGSSLVWFDNSMLDSIVIKTAGTYSIKAVCTKEGCNSDSSYAIVAEIKSNVVPTITSNSPICQGSTLSLSSSLADSYSWIGPAGPLNSTQSLLVEDADAGRYYLTVIYTNSCTANDSAEVSFNAILTKPTIAPTSLDVCAPNTVTLSATCQTGTVIWSNNSTNSSLTFSEPDSYSVKAACTLNGCTSDSTDAIAVLIKPIIDFSAGSNSPICSGSPLSLSSTIENENYDWTGPNSFTSNSQNPAVVPPVAGAYVLTVTYANACTLTKTTEVIITPKPSAPNVPTPGSLIVCEPNTISFSGTCPAGTLKWSDNSSGAVLKLSSPTVYGIFANCTYNGCISNSSNTINAEIKAQPALPTIVPPTESYICTPGTLTLSGSCAAGSILWSDNSTNGNLVLSSPRIYSITASCNLNSCSSGSTLPLSLEIKQTPSVPIITGPASASKCAPDSLLLSASCTTGTVLWSNGVVGNNLTLKGAGNYSISAVCVLEGCSSDASAPVIMEIKSAPASSASGTKALCAGGAINLTVSPGVSYSWTGPNAYSSNLQNPSITNAGILMSGIYTAEVTFANGCSSVDTTSVAVNTSPVVNISASPNVVASGESSTLTLNGCTGGEINWSINNSSSNPLTLAIFNTTTFNVACTINGCTSVASTIVTASNPCETLVNLENITDDYISGVITKKASALYGKITANNKLSGDTRVNYEAKSIELNAGFGTESGVVFSAEIGGCN